MKMARPKKFILLYVLIFSIYVHTFLNDGFLISYPGVGAYGGLGESRIIGRLTKTGVDGIFSDSGFTGFCIKEGDPQDWNYYCSTVLQSRFYNSRSCPVFIPYMSQSGVQAMVYSLFSGIYGRWLGPYLFARILNAGLLSLVLCLFMAWIHRKFGLFTSILSFSLTLSLKWLSVVGDNINLVNGLAFLPLVFLLWNYELGKSTTFKVAFASLLIRYLFSGAEYFTINLAMVFSPMVFYSIQDGWKNKRISSELRHLITALLISTMVAAAILSVQMMTYQVHPGSEKTFSNSLKGMVDYFIFRIQARSLLTQKYFNPSDREMEKIPLKGLLTNYLNTNAVDLGLLRLSFLELVLIYFLTTLLALLGGGWSEDIRLNALIKTCWFSLLGPLSWIILAKGHAVIHWAYDPIVWDMPFTIFGMLLIAATINSKLTRRKPTESNDS